MAKIIYVITNLATGGAEVVLLNTLQNIDRSHFQPTVISLMGRGEIGPRIAALGIPVHTLGMRPGIPNPWVLVRLAKLLRQLQPDVVHTWMYHADLLGGLAARLVGCRRVVWHLHHSDLSKAHNKRSTLAVVALCARLSRWVPRVIVSCSQRAQQVHADVGYAAEKIQLIPNGFDLERYAPDVAARASVRTELGLPPDAPLVGVVARFDPLKNHLGLVQAAAQVLQHYPQVHFVLAGTDVDARNAVLQAAIAARPGLAAHMHLLGRRDDVPRLMAALDVLALPSHGESFGNVLCEAMASGVTCVTTDCGGPAEIVGDIGRVVPVGDMDGLACELVAVLNLPAAERAALGQQARARVQANYEIGHVTRMYEAMYERVTDV